ncbi:MAG: polysaccharide deacetylase family protein [Lachnospiraceae bacterium]|nr:polysaccharide deacetylase family protein [Lachnospiraceae bacterium]
MEIRMRFPQGMKKALTLSYDDGVEQDARLINIMKKNGLRGTFNLNSGRYRAEGTTYEPGEVQRRLSEKEATQLYKDSGMEVAVHGLTHPFLERIPDNLCIAEIVKDRENLEKQFGAIVRGAAYPYGTYSDKVVDIMRMSGIAYARTTLSTENFDIPQDWLRLNPTCHHINPALKELATEFVEERRRDRGYPLLFYLWGHSYEFEKDDNWEVIERFASYVGGRKDIWYATNIEIYEYVEAYKSLVFSMDGERVYNPSCIEIYLEADGKKCSIAPGETLEL